MDLYSLFQDWECSIFARFGISQWSPDSSSHYHPKKGSVTSPKSARLSIYPLGALGSPFAFSAWQHGFHHVESERDVQPHSCNILQGLVVAAAGRLLGLGLVEPAGPGQQLLPEADLVRPRAPAIVPPFSRPVVPPALELLVPVPGLLVLAAGVEALSSVVDRFLLRLRPESPPWLARHRPATSWTASLASCGTCRRCVTFCRDSSPPSQSEV